MLVTSEPRTILSALASRDPDSPALVDAAGTVSRAELAALAAATAAWLTRRGVRPGDRVLVRAGAHRTTVAALFGCLRAGAVFVPYATDTTGYQLAHLVADADPALLLTDDPSDLDNFPGVGAVPGALVDELRAAEPVSEAPDPPVGPDDLALLLYTSGSTARPKAVACTHGQVAFAARAVAARVRYRAEDVVLCRLPLSFDYGLYQTFLTFQAGGTLVLADATRDARFLVDLAATGVTVLPLVPSLATMLLRLATRRATPALTSPRLVTSTGEHLPAATIAGLRRVFPRAGVQIMFGTTECKRITVHEVDGDRDRPGSVGRPLPGTSVHILDDQGREVPAGRSGQIAVRGPHLMAGYWRAPEQTAARYRRDADGGRTLLTGDHGHLDAEGYLYFDGRRDHLFKLRGVRTSTVEIEDAAGRVPGVDQAVVLPPDQSREAVLVVVASAGPEQVLVGLRALLGPARTPATCRVVAAMPLTANGKVDRRALGRLVDGGRA